MTKSDCPLCVAKRTYYAEAADFRLVPGPDIRQKTSLFDGGTKKSPPKGRALLESGRFPNYGI